MKRLLLIILLFITGCASWQKVGGLYTSTRNNFSVELPDEWMKLNKDEYLYITRDGELLQNVLIKRLNIDESLAFTKKKFKKEILPVEAAEVVIDNMTSTPAVLNLAVVENTPTNISGLPGFKVVLTYKNKSGLTYECIYYGFISGEWFYGISYTAPLRHYFDKDVKTFEEVIKSFKLIKTT